MKISFLLQNAYGIGGTIRSTFNVAGALADRHTVEIVSVLRNADRPRLPLGPGVRLVHLIDERPGKGADLGHELLDQDSALIPPAEARGARFNALTDRRVADHLATTDADVVIATRPGLVMYLARFGRDRCLRIGQEHRIYGTHEPAIRAGQDAAVPLLDAYTTVSEADAVTHRKVFAGAGTAIVCVPNACPPSRVEPADPAARLVIAAGRLIPVKRYDLLVTAWATVAAAHPGWRLRLYGRGPRRDRLREQIDRLGLNDSLTLMGARSPLETEWAKGSIAAVTSREESFGMTIVEAMQCGLPVVSTDCPHGPREIITQGEDGLLVPISADAIAQGLLTLIEDGELRAALGARARRSAARYAPERIADAYLALIDDLGGPRARTATGSVLRAAGPVRMADGSAPGATGPVRAADGSALREAGSAPAADGSVRAADGSAPQATGPVRATTDSVPAAGGGAARRTVGGAIRPLRRAVGRAVRPLRRGFRVVAGVTGPPLTPLRPVACCRVDAAGDVVVSVSGEGVDGERSTLTVTRRGSGEVIRVPLVPPAGGTGPHTAVLRRRELRLGEGRWDLHVVRAGDRGRRRVVCDLAEGKGLLSLEPLPGAPFTWWVPYPTTDGYLALRTWHRPAHAEARTLRMGGDGFTVEGTVYGATLAPDGAPVVIAAPRTGSSSPVSVSAEALDASRFRVHVPYDRLTEAGSSTGPSAGLGPGDGPRPVWDLALRRAPGAAPIRIGRIIGDLADLADRHRVEAHPTVRGVRPYVTRSGDLSVTLPGPLQAQLPAPLPSSRSTPSALPATD
ncbi:glycosyltransferase [Streptomyces sp. URMC 123]|uniref:glycosyltransferase n=1 Tax=Streptomyces sp. URMC 123 TaxID=3423403 RepID=UPI003F1B12C5